jgi:hypothetical protein
VPELIFPTFPAVYLSLHSLLNIIAIFRAINQTHFSVKFAPL